MSEALIFQGFRRRLSKMPPVDARRGGEQHRTSPLPLFALRNFPGE
jgi:hypothetical protein